MAPEVQNLKSGQVYDGRKVDIFNLGYVLFAMVFKKFPFSTNKNSYSLEALMENDPIEFWDRLRDMGVNVDSVSSKCRNLIFSLLQPTPENRPSVDQILTNDWITSPEVLCESEVVKELENRRYFME